MELREIVLAAVTAYRKAMRAFADQTALQVWYAHADQAAVQARFGPDLDRARRKKLDRAFGKAQTKDNLGALRPLRGEGGRTGEDRRGSAAHRADS
jgi:hypothetical protein